MTQVTALVYNIALDEHIVHAACLRVIPAMLGEGIGGNNLATPRVTVFVDESYIDIDLLVCIESTTVQSHSAYDFGDEADRDALKLLVEDALHGVLGEIYPWLNLRVVIKPTWQPIVPEPAAPRPAVDMDLALHLAKVDAAYIRLLKGQIGPSGLFYLDQDAYADVIAMVIERGSPELKEAITDFSVN
jgi:hypothetical protein